MEELAVLISRQPIVPYIRESDIAVRQQWKLGRRRLLDYMLIYIQEGLCLVEVEGRVHRLREGQFCLIQPGDQMSIEGMERKVTPFAHFDIFYNPRREESFPARPGQLEISEFAPLLQPRLNDCRGFYVPVKVSPSEPERFRDLFLKMIGLWQLRDPLHQLEAQQIATELILLLLSDHGGRSQTITSSGPLLQWVTSFFSLHLAEPLTIEDMAARAGLSASRFTAVFRQQFGMPPHKYLLQLRIQHARELLLAGQHSIKEITEFCGFSDVYHFTKTFKAVTGTPPGRYRKTKERE